MVSHTHKYIYIYNIHLHIYIYDYCFIMKYTALLSVLLLFFWFAFEYFLLVDRFKLYYLHFFYCYINMVVDTKLSAYATISNYLYSLIYNLISINFFSFLFRCHLGATLLSVIAIVIFLL